MCSKLACTGSLLLLQGVSPGSPALVQGAVQRALRAAESSYSPYTGCPAGLALVSISGGQKTLSFISSMYHFMQ